MLPCFQYDNPTLYLLVLANIGHDVRRGLSIGLQIVTEMFMDEIFIFFPDP